MKLFFLIHMWWRCINRWEMVLLSFLGDWEFRDEVEFVEDKASGGMPFLFFNFCNLLLPPRIAATRASWSVPSDVLFLWSKRAFTWYFLWLLSLLLSCYLFDHVYQFMLFGSIGMLTLLWLVITTLLLEVYCRWFLFDCWVIIWKEMWNHSLIVVISPHPPLWGLKFWQSNLAFLQFDRSIFVLGVK